MLEKKKNSSRKHLTWVKEINNFNPQFNTTDRAYQIFGNLDLDCDGEITEQEFVDGCMQDEELVETLNCEKHETDE